MSLFDIFEKIEAMATSAIENAPSTELEIVDED